MSPHQLSHKVRVAEARAFAPDAARRIRNATNALRVVVACKPTPDTTIKGDTDLEAAAKRRRACGTTPSPCTLEAVVKENVVQLLERIQRTHATVLLTFTDGTCRMAASVTATGAIEVTSVLA